MQLHKTDRARAELKPGVRTLGQRERTLLLMADGSRSAQDFLSLFDGHGEQIALRLLREGFLEAHPGQRQEKPAATASAAPVSTAAQRQNRPGPDTPQALQVSADPFEGKRSLATTRMFLFDMGERMFARRSPDMAERFRDALRNAKDRDTMLAVSRAMLEEIEKVAGPERADSISERLAMLLPADAAFDLSATSPA